MDPVEQIFAQARAPTSQSNSGYEALVQGRQLAQRDRQLNMQQREQDVLLQLRAQSEALQNQSTGLDIQLKLLTKQRELDVKTGQSEALNIMLDAAKLENGFMDDSITQRIKQLGVTNPAALNSPIGQALVNNWRGAEVVSQAMTRANMANLPLKSITTDETGKSVTTFQRDDPFANERLRLEGLRLEQGNTRLGQGDIRLQAQRLRDEADLLEKGQTIQPGPAGQPIVVQGPKPLTTANVTAAQTDVLAARSAIASVDQAISTLVRTPGAAGVRGAVGEVAEGVAGQVGINLGTEITAARTQLRETAHQLVSALRVESGQMSNWERQMLEDVASPLSWKLDDQTAIAKMETIRRLIGLRELRRSKALGQAPTELHTLTDKDLVEATKAQYITPDIARAEYQRRGRKP